MHIKTLVKFPFSYKTGSKILVGSGIAYLVLPFLIFAFFWLNLLPTLIITILVSLSIKDFLFEQDTFLNTIKFPSAPKLIGGTLILVVWLLLSGVGGYMFQNWDFHWRNAVFRDLINQSWPVSYNSDNSQIDLVYYIGFWLPSAIIGKLTSWKLAQFALFLWSLLGLFLIWMFISIWEKKYAIKHVIIFCLFSGLDIIAVLLFYKPNPSWIFHATHHIEDWSIQISSNSTLLFWVFHQAIPGWLATSLILNLKKPKHIILIGSCCLFNSPFAAIGLIPFILFKVWYTTRQSTKIFRKTKILPDKQQLQEKFFPFINNFFNSEIFLSTIIIIVIIFYFGCSETTSKMNIKPPSLVVIISFLFEGGILWIILLIRKENQKEFFLILSGLMLAVSLLLVSDTHNFGMRIAIPANFVLMLYSIKEIDGECLVPKILISVLLIIGSYTSFSEINRSLILSYDYYKQIGTTNNYANPSEDEISYELNYFPVPEKAHAKSLTADYLISLDNPNIAINHNFYGKISNHWLFKSAQ